MKALVLKITSAVCVILSLVLFFYPTVLELDNVRRSELREFRQEMLDDLEEVKEGVVSLYAYDDDFSDDMQDNGLPKTKGAAKERFNEAEEVIKHFLDGKVSMMDIVGFSAKAPKFIKDTDNLFQSDYGKTVFAISEFTTYSEAENVIDSVADFSFLLWLVVAFFVIFSLLGLTAAILPLFNKVKFLRWVYCVVLILLTAGICVCVTTLSSELSGTLALTGGLEDMTLKMTVFPFIAVVLAIASIVLGIISNKKERVENHED